MYLFHPREDDGGFVDLVWVFGEFLVVQRRVQMAEKWWWVEEKIALL